MEKKSNESLVSGLAHEIKMRTQMKKIFDGCKVAEVKVKNQHLESILRVKNDENFEYKYHHLIYEAIKEEIQQSYIAHKTDNIIFPVTIIIMREGKERGVWETTCENFLKIFTKK